MEQLNNLLHPLEPQHREALTWFHKHGGEEVSWAELLALGEQTGQRLVTAAKGIYKPEGWLYALSVRQVINSRYADSMPLLRADGTWLYQYFQENSDPALRDEQYTNRGLISCMRDRVPVGALLQVSPKPSVRYRVLGVALVAVWDAGRFFLEGFTSSGSAHTPGTATEREMLLYEATLEVAAEEKPLNEKSSSPESFQSELATISTLDARRRVLAAIVRRQGQGAFRQVLLDAYDRQCAVTGCEVEATLEAAHIIPYNGPQSNQVANGLLLRADIHTLFDLGYIAIDSSTMVVRIAPQLTATSYANLDGTQLRLPANARAHPSTVGLDLHRAWTGL